MAKVCTMIVTANKALPTYGSSLWRLMLVTTLSAVCLSSCSSGPDVPVETVMPVGSSLTVPTNELPVTITAVSRLGRRYSWGDNSVTYDLWPRGRRFNGDLGMYLPTLPPYPATKALSHIVVSESQLHYHSVSALIKQLRIPPYDRGWTKQWTSDGLFVSFHFERSAGFLALEDYVTQYCINGEKPKNLPGASAFIALKDQNGRKIDTLPCAHVDEKAYFDTWPKDQDYRD
jgi:hypothetical protein